MVNKITAEDLINKGVIGLPDVPGLTTIEMQKKLDEISIDVIIPRFNELIDNTVSASDEFSKLNTYNVGDYCIYQGVLYKCTTAITTAGEWDATKWKATSIDKELKEISSYTENKDVISDKYDSSKTYSVGDYCIYNDTLYKCKTAVTSAEEFDSSKWEATNCGKELVALNSNFSQHLSVLTDFKNHKLINPGKLHNLDKGFDVYATQAFNAPNGKVYEISWVGLPDTTYPTDNENWANCLSQVKKLSIKDGKLMQKPVSAMQELRYNEKEISDENKASQQYEAELTIKAGQKGSLYLAANDNLTSGLKLDFDTENGTLILDRSNAGQKVSVDYGETRQANFEANTDLKLNIFIDHSLIEIFVNHGEEVLTGRYFADQNNTKFAFAQKTHYNGKLWQMKTIL